MFINPSCILIVILSVSYVSGNSVKFDDDDLNITEIVNVDVGGKTELEPSGRESARDPRFFDNGFLNSIIGGIFGGKCKPFDGSFNGVGQGFVGNKPGRCPGLFELFRQTGNKKHQQDYDEEEDEDYYRRDKREVGPTQNETDNTVSAGDKVVPAEGEGRFFESALGNIFKFGDKCTNDYSCPGQLKCCGGIFGLPNYCQNPSFYN